eukprot:COSAG01_NODE_39_length_33243_cov_28.298558_20_plen_137_part_00
MHGRPTCPPRLAVRSAPLSPGARLRMHPAGSAYPELDVDALPSHVLYHEIVATSQTYMRQVVAVDPDWILPMLRKIRELEPERLMGRRLEPGWQQGGAPAVMARRGGAAQSGGAPARRNDEAAVAAARARYLARRK